jgi:alkylation response protein AidB-like acyl-CoA dehydrogenase
MAVGFNLGLSSEQVELRSYLHGTASPELRGIAADAESSGVDAKVLARHLDAAGIAPVTLLERGVGEPHTLLVAVEELSYGDAGIAWASVPAFQIATVVGACGSVEQKLAASEVFAGDQTAAASVLLYEDFGRQPSELETRVSKEGGGWRVDGRKSSVAHPGAGDVSLVLGREADELAAFCFVGQRPGITAERDDREVGKVALTAVPSGPAVLDALVLDAGERLAGGIALHRAVGQSRLLLAACLLGLTRASLEFCSAYAVQRKTWGKPLAEYQGVSFPLIEQTTELAEVRLLLWDVAARLSSLDEVDDIERQVSRAVNRASSLGLRATRNGVQLIGVRAITRDLPAERWYRSAAVLGAIDFDVMQTPFGLN